ncbi:MAG: clan AA aspartic protease [Anaerolineales bacterium]|nr:clan AA aspartic protease [Anaerolineales bacterium]
MTRYVDEYRRCWVEISVAGARQEMTLLALVDTGFDGWVCLPMPIAIQLGLELFGLQVVELGDGSEIEELVFRGEVIFNQKRRDVDITLTNSADALLGTGLLEDSVLTIDFVERTVEIVQKEE